MPDLNGWPLLCFIVMAVIWAATILAEKGDR